MADNFPAPGSVLSETDIRQLGLTEAELTALAKGQVSPQALNATGDQAQVVKQLLAGQAAAFKEKLRKAAANSKLARPATLESLPGEERQRVEKVAGDMAQRLTALANGEAPASHVLRQASHKAMGLLDFRQPVAPPPAQQTEPEVRDLVPDDLRDKVTMVDPVRIVDDREEESKKTPEAAPVGDTMGPRHCPNCAWDMSRPVEEVDEADKDNFRRSLLSGQPFVKTYTLFDGESTVTFKSRTRRASDMINARLLAEIKGGELTSDGTEMSRLAYITRLYGLQMVAGLRDLPLAGIHNFSDIADRDFQTRFGGEKDALSAAHDTVVEAIGSDALYSILYGRFLEFNALEGRLVAGSRVPGFYAGSPGPR